MIKKFLILSFIVAPWLNAQVSTPVVGFNKLTFPAGNSTHTATFIKGNTFQGTATSKTSNSITVSTGSFSGLAPSGGLPTHYVKILGGAMDGYTLDILASSPTVLTLDGDISTAGTTPTFIIRQHVKASDLFKTSTGLSPGLDTLTIFNPDASSTVLLWAGSESSTGWIDIFTESVADAVLYPGQGFVLTTVGSGTYTFSGTVETTPTVVPLFTGTVNLVARANPSSSQASLQTINLGTGMTLGLDTVEFWSQNGSISSDGVFLWGGADGFLDIFTEQVSARTVGPNEVMNVTVVTPTTWKVSAPYTP